MSEKPHYESLEESVLRDLADRMQAAKLHGDHAEFDAAKKQLADTLKALAGASPGTRQKYEHLLGVTFGSDS